MRGHIIVTSAAGPIGSHLTDRLLADRHTVVRIDSIVQRHVCVVPLSVAADDVCMLPNRR